MLTGTRLGPYEVLAPLGAGGMGEVYRARDESLGREVAVKVLPADSMADPDRLRRFEQEAKAAGALNHPTLVTVFDAGQRAVALVVEDNPDMSRFRMRRPGRRVRAYRRGLGAGPTRR